MIIGQILCPCGCRLSAKKEIIADADTVSHTLSKYYGDNVVGVVSSGGRCRDHHRKVYLDLGYHEEKIPWSSRHLSGHALDLYYAIVNGELKISNIIPPIQVAYLIEDHMNYLKLVDIKGIGTMNNSLHIDHRRESKHWIRKDGDYAYGVDFKVLVKNEK